MLKSLCLTNTKKQILYLSKCYEGSQHDYKLLQDGFAPSLNWFKQKRVRLDLGFQGFKEVYKCRKMYIPYKKKRVKKGACNELSEAQKSCNKAQAAEHIKRAIELSPNLAVALLTSIPIRLMPAPM